MDVNLGFGGIEDHVPCRKGGNRLRELATGSNNIPSGLMGYE
jgi:hypothetical protein